MERVDAKEEIDELFRGLSDVEHYIGTIRVPDAPPMAFARLVFMEDAPLRPWPKKLVARVAMEAVSGVTLFAIFDPDVGILESYVATEWNDSYQSFIELSEKHHVFMMELVTPKRKRQALIVKGEVQHSREIEITQEDFEHIRECYTPPPAPPHS